VARLLPTMVKLSYLGLNCNDIGDEGVAALAAALSDPGCCPQLKSLTLKANARIGDAAADSLSKMVLARGAGAQLRDIQLHGSAAMTEKGRRRLAETRDESVSSNTDIST